MAKRKVGDECCCKVESVVTVDKRGQLVLPKEVREAAGLAAGDKLAVVLHGERGGTCCITLFKAGRLSGAAMIVIGERPGPRAEKG